MSYGTGTSHERGGKLTALSEAPRTLTATPSFLEKKKKKADQQQNEANLQLRDTSADGGGWGGSGLIICDVSRPPPRARLARNLVPNEPYAELVGS